jgi:hypothetical protein
MNPTSPLFAVVPSEVGAGVFGPRVGDDVWKLAGLMVDVAAHRAPPNAAWTAAVFLAMIGRTGAWALRAAAISRS